MFDLSVCANLGRLLSDKLRTPVEVSPYRYPEEMDELLQIRFKDRRFLWEERCSCIPDQNDPDVRAILKVMKTLPETRSFATGMQQAFRSEQFRSFTKDRYLDYYESLRDYISTHSRSPRPDFLSNGLPGLILDPSISALALNSALVFVDFVFLTTGTRLITSEASPSHSILLRFPGATFLAQNNGDIITEDGSALDWHVMVNQFFDPK